MTQYNTTRDQRDNPEDGPVLSLGAVCTVGSVMCHFVAYQNGTGRVAFLQSTIPSMTYSDLNCITKQREFDYARQYGDILKKELHNKDDYKQEYYLSIRDSAIRKIFDRHCVYLACKGQGGDEWGYLRSFTLTSTMCHAILPRSEEGLSQEEVQLLKNDLGLALRSAEDVEVDISWQHKSEADLRQLSNEELKVICNSYSGTFSNKEKDQLIATVNLGPVMMQTIREVEKILKYSFLQPLGPQEHSAHKLGSLNEERVRSVIASIVSN